MPKRKIHQPIKQEQAVWFIKLTPTQANAFWEVFCGCGLNNNVAKETFFRKISHVRLRIVECISPIHYSRKNSLGKGHLEFYFEDNPLFRILECGGHPFYTNGERAKHPEAFGNSRLPKTVPYANSRIDGLTHAKWVKRLLALA